jgi:pilus assembly protein CpaB
MNRRSRHLVVLMVAVVTATIASFAVYKAISGMPARAAEARQLVVVAARSMAIGTELTAADVKVVSWPAESPISGAVGDVTKVVSRGLLTAVLENEPLTANKLASMDAGAGLSPAIPRGMRAMSVRVNDVIGVAGFVVPGTRVDVLVTIRRTSDSMTRTAASNVQVLTAGTRLDQGKPESDAKTANASTVVTLMVSPQDAERIALAQAEGDIMLVLRNPLDTEPVMTTGVRTASLLGTDEAPVSPPVLKAPAPRRAPVATAAPVEVKPPEPRQIEAIRGAKRTKEEVIR